MATESFTAAGTYTWIAPSWITTVDLLLLGGGGGGDPGTAGVKGGGGGGGGESAQTTGVAVTAGSSYTIIVAAGGGVSTNGGDSSFATTTVVAKGGKKGALAVGGAGGTGGTGSTLYDGGAGGAAVTAINGAGGGGGGSAGSTGAGNAGAAGSGTTGGAGGAPVDSAAGTGGNGADFGPADGTAGGPPGAGGGGGTAGILSGYAGAAGAVILTYADAPSPVGFPVVAGTTPPTLALFMKTVGTIFNSLIRDGYITQTAATEWVLANIVSSFNGRTGAVTLTSADVTTALGDTHIAYTDVANTFTVAPQAITIDADAHVGLAVQRHSSSQSANLQEWRNESGVAKAWVSPTLSIVASGTYTASAAVAGVTLGLAGGTPRIQFADGTNSAEITLESGPYLRFLVGNEKMRIDSANSLISFGLNLTVGANVGTSPPFSDTRAWIYGNVSNDVGVKPTVVLEQNDNGTPTAGFGGSIYMAGKSSTTSQRAMGEIQWLWATVTDAARKARMVLGVHDSSTSRASPREGFRVESSGSAPMIGFLGVAAVVQQANASQAAITAVTDANAQAALQAIYNLLVQYGLAPATA